MTPPPDLTIVHLVDAPEAAPILADWFVAEWYPWYGPDGGGDAAADLAACGSRDALPLCLVALGREDAVLGTIALKDESVGSETGAGPWLAAFLVGDTHRGQGIGRALVEALEREARRLAFPAIYTSSELGAEVMARRGWLAGDRAQSLRGPITIYRRELNLPPDSPGCSE